MIKYFTKHPESIGETYFQHLWFTARCGFRMIFAGIIVIFHGLFPFVFQCTATNILFNLIDKRTFSLKKLIETKLFESEKV